MPILVKGNDIRTGTKANPHHGRHRRQWVKNTFNRCFPKARRLNSLHHNRLDAENTIWFISQGTVSSEISKDLLFFSQDSTIS